MTNPDGEDGWVPADASHKALAQGYKFTEATAAPDRGIAENLVGGVMEGASKTVQGGANLLAKGAEHVLGMPPGSLQAGRTETENPALARSVGNIAEEAGEWIMGDAAFKAIPYVQRLEMAQKVAATADESPIVARLLHAGLSVFRGGTVGAAEGGVKGAATGQAGGGAEKGAVAGAIGGAGEEILGAVAPSIRKLNPFLPQEQTVAKGAISDAADLAASRAGAAPGAAPSEVGMRTALDAPIAEVHANERALYDKVNDWAGTDMKSLYDDREVIQDALDDPTTTNTAELQARLKTAEKEISAGEKNVRATGGADAAKMIQQAEGITKTRHALEEFNQKFMNNPSVVSGNVQAGAKEIVNVDNAIKAAERLDQPSRWAPQGSPSRLEQVFGKDGALQFKKALYLAQERGQRYENITPFLKKVGTGAALTLGGEGAYQAVKHYIH